MDHSDRVLRQERNYGDGFAENQNLERAQESEKNGESHQILPLLNMVLFMKTIKSKGIYIFPRDAFCMCSKLYFV